MNRKILVLLSIIAALLVTAPTASAGKAKGANGNSASTFGATTLEVAPATLEALTGLGVSPGVVSSASLDGATYSFPITNSFRSALRSGIVRHSGGISLSAGGTVVRLTDFEIRLFERQLYGKVNGSGPVALLDLDYSHLRVRFRDGRLVLGPVRADLTQGAADALNQAFGTSALTGDTPIGKARIGYQLFPSA